MKSAYYPMLAMFFWTFAVMLRNIQVRLSAVANGKLTNRYFELFREGEPPLLVVQTGNHLRNLFEFPLLFYPVVLAAMLMGAVDAVVLAMAWIYVALRIGHSIVHLTFNKVPPRFVFWMSSNIVLLAMWIWLALRLPPSSSGA